MKINAPDFQPGGFDINDSAHAVGLQDSEGVDLVEISGGTYESGPRGSRGSFRLGLEGVLTGRVVDVFSDQLDAWLDYTESPWGRIRYGWLLTPGLAVSCP